jgi:hypothetical protein
LARGTSAYPGLDDHPSRNPKGLPNATDISPLHLRWATPLGLGVWGGITQGRLASLANPVAPLGNPLGV